MAFSAFSNFEFRILRTHALPGFFYLTLSKIDEAAAQRVKFDDVGRAGEQIGARWSGKWKKASYSRILPFHCV